MPIETRTVLTCGHCGSPKAEANGWYLVTHAKITLGAEGTSAARHRIIVEHADDDYLGMLEHLNGFESNMDAACGRECVIKMVSEALANLKHTDHASHDHDPKNTPRRWRKSKGTQS